MTVSDARVSGESEGDCAGDAPTEISTIGDGGCRASLCLFCSSVVGGSAAPEGITPVSGVPSVGSVVIGVGGVLPEQLLSPSMYFPLWWYSMAR